MSLLPKNDIDPESENPNFENFSIVPAEFRFENLKSRISRICNSCSLRTFPDVTLPVIPPALFSFQKTEYENQSSLINTML